jgi:hypothetical protein
MITGKSASDFQNKMERLDELIAIYSDNLNSANVKAVQDGVLEGAIESVNGISTSNYDNFTMFIDRWGTSPRKVGR